MFDGSSISGWKGINESDMILMPDPASAVLDIFTEETTVNLRCRSSSLQRCRATTAARARWQSVRRPIWNQPE